MTEITAKIVYKGDLRNEIMHVRSGNVLLTDAPIDNHGKGESFSPTDLLASSLGGCMLTIMGIKAADLGVDLAGSTAEITKIMANDPPRRIAKIRVKITLPSCLDDKTRQLLTSVAELCPVAKSLHPSIEQEIIFV